MAQSARPVVIRPAEPSDADDLARLHVAVWRATYRDYASAEAVAALDEDRRRPYWTSLLGSGDANKGAHVAGQGDTILGVVSFGPSDHEIFGGRLEIKHFYVDPTAQGQGIGRRLLRAVLEQDSNVALAVVAQNEQARAFYRMMGGVEIGTFIDPGPLWRSDNIVLAWG